MPGQEDSIVLSLKKKNPKNKKTAEQALMRPERYSLVKWTVMFQKEGHRGTQHADKAAIY